MGIPLIVNGARHEIDVDPETPLLYVLRNDLGLKGTRFGCGSGQCGACMVLIGGRPVPSCNMPISEVSGAAITTIEGLASGGEPHPLQRAFVVAQAGQCGYCLSGIIISAKALLDANPRPTDTEIRGGLDANLCRCGSHPRILRAIRAVARGAE